jgi:hypothetical protein
MAKPITILSISAAFLALSVAPALAGTQSLVIALGTVSTPFGNEGLLALAAGGVIGGVWLARRKR